MISSPLKVQLEDLLPLDTLAASTGHCDSHLSTALADSLHWLLPRSPQSDKFGQHLEVVPGRECQEVVNSGGFWLQQIWQEYHAVGKTQAELCNNSVSEEKDEREGSQIEEKGGEELNIDSVLSSSRNPFVDSGRASRLVTATAIQIAAMRCCHAMLSRQPGFLSLLMARPRVLELLLCEAAVATPTTGGIFCLKFIALMSPFVYILVFCDLLTKSRPF